MNQDIRKYSNIVVMLASVYSIIATLLGFFKPTDVHFILIESVVLSYAFLEYVEFEKRSRK